MKMRYIISGVAFTGNKGASGMATAIIQNLTEADPDNRFHVMTYYPVADSRLPLAANITLLSATPPAVVLNCIAACWAAFCRVLRLPECLYIKNKTVQAIVQADYWLDTSGISFVDGREKFLIYNVMSILPALLLKCPVVKMPQALGPFNGKINRLAARCILPRLKFICARGRKTYEHLETLSLKNYESYPDIAFSLKTSDADKQAAQKIMTASDKKIVGISPSQVVFKLCQKKKIPYFKLLKETVEKLLHEDYQVVIFAHSSRPDTEKRHNNDLPLLNEFSETLPPHPNLQVITEELSAAELRELIRIFDVLLGSRFHALVSAIATLTPAVMLGWSHKYAEVLEDFEMGQYSIDFADADSEKLTALIHQIEADKDKIIDNIKKSLPSIHDRMKALYAQLSQQETEVSYGKTE